MRKLLLTIVVCLLLIYTAFFMVRGINAINFKGFMDLREKNQQLEDGILDLYNASNKKFKDAQTDQKKAINNLVEKRTEYENQATLSNYQTSSYVTQTESYDVEYLWTKLGNYASDEKCSLSVNVSFETEIEMSEDKKLELYNLQFTVAGSYAGVTDFIYDVENDSKLGFEIEEFQMSGSGTDGVIAVFTCKEIPISEMQVKNTGKGKEEGDTENTTDENTTDENSTEENLAEEESEEESNS